MTFRTRENFCTEYMQFEVADFGTPYNAFLEWQTLTRFMPIHHYAYSVFKEVRTTWCHLRQGRHQACLRLRQGELRHPRCLSRRRTHSVRWSRYPRMSPVRSLMWGIVWIPKRNSHSSNSFRKIGTSLHGSLLT
jgi:hypothetical protein